MNQTPRRIEHDLGQQRLLTVLLPEDYGQGARDYPLLLCLDAQWLLGTVADSALLLGLARLMPRVLIAGLGWSHADLRDSVVARAHAYTPTVAPFPPEVVAPASRTLLAGGGPAFLDFMVSDVLGLLERRYPLAVSSRCLVGHSLSGLFGLFTAATRPALFDRYLLASPSVWWQDRAILPLLASSTAIRGRLYMTMGEEEGLIAGCPMRETAEAAARILRERNPLLSARVEVLAGEVHASTAAGSVTRGLRWLFG